MELTEVERERLAKLEQLRASGIEPYPLRSQFVRQRIMAAEAVRRALASAQDHTAAPTNDAHEPEVAVMGRIVARRVMGKAAFLGVEDASGKIQFYARVGEDSLDAASFARFKELDLGDFIEAKGVLFVTKTGEPSLRVTDWRLLAKSISPLPIAKEEKQPDGSVVRYSAFSDPELRYRQRYVDLAVNPEVREIFVTRAKIIKAIREFLDDKGFLEVETPILQPIYGGAAARPFITHHNQLDQDLYLRISFELYLKRLIVGNLERVYEIGRDFRNEGVSFKHNPEFTQLEFYAAYMDMYDVMDLAEEMLQYVARRVLPPEAEGKSRFRGHVIHWLQPFKRIKLRDAILEKTGVDYAQFPDRQSLADEVVRRKLLSPELIQGKPWGKIIDSLIGDYVEKALIEPTFLYEYPRDISPFAKSIPGDPNTVERFEGFVGGVELCNAFSELNDPFEQRQRFLEEVFNAEEGEANPVDEDYVRALMYGMPVTGGFGMGIDRLVMMFTNRDSIREVLLFPALRQEERATAR
ncbi:MAG: lysine--tRNA ligase [Thermoflexales bacterium]|nr:lysine--tRNA ligase [Thermoflexales bacterium]MDW8351051.1 lysine--tRNA ligase [Anaerolineae bacterium]